MAVLAGEHAAAQRGPREQPETQGLGRAEQVGLGRAVDQGVLDLVGHQRDARLLEQRQGPRALPARCSSRPRHSGPGPVLTAHSSADSVSVSGASSDHVCTSQRSTWSVPSRSRERVELAEQAVPRGVDDALARAPGDAGLGADDQVVAVDVLVDDAAEELLGGTVGVAVSRVDEGPAGVDGRCAAGRGRPPRRCCGPRSSCRGRAGTPTARRCPFVCGACLRTVVRSRRAGGRAAPPIACPAWNSA